MNLFEKICLGAMTAFAGFVLIEVALFVREARIDADKITGQMVGLALPTKNAEAAIASAALVFAQVGAHERDAFQQQQDYFRGLSTRTNTLLDSAAATVRLFNESVLPRVATALDGTTVLETNAARDLTDTAAKIDASIDSLTSGTREMIDGGIKATTAAAAAMSDPAIHEILAHVDGVAGNLDATSGDIHAFVHRETTPVRGTWNVIKSFLEEFAGPAAQVATAVK
jgi:hypothetical protein